VPLLKAALLHQGIALIDVISPCVTFNNTSGSTKSYQYVRDHIEATGTFDFIPLRQEIVVEYDEGATQAVTMHDGSVITLHKSVSGIDVTSRRHALDLLEAEREQGRLLTGILFLDPESEDTHAILKTSLTPLNQLSREDLCPGAAALDESTVIFAEDLPSNQSIPLHKPLCMSLLTLIGIAVALAMDAFAVAIAVGISLKSIHYRQVFRLAWHFGLFQAMMPVIGWAAGTTVRSHIQDYDHWIAFALLTLVGGNMLREAFSATKRRTGPGRMPPAA